jgi:DNA-directed RNA polymerase subunit F
MIKVKVKQNVSNKPKFFLLIFAFAIIMAIITFGADKISGIFSNSKDISNNNSSQIKSILSKEENLLTIEEWKKIADHRALEFSECSKDLANDLESLAVYENCYRHYNNAWVVFQLGLDEKSNLTYEQREQLKEYWKKTEDDMREKVIKLMEQKEKELRPNRYN